MKKYKPVLEKPKKILLFISCSLLLTSCSGGGGGSNSNLSSTESNTGPSIEGRVADGYIRNATVCLDLNRNTVCDPSEPSTLSETGGYYQLSGIDPDTVDQYPVIVEIRPENNPVDEGDGTSTSTEIVLTRSFFLTAPAGRSGFISPLTTLIALQATSDPTLGIDEAETMIKSAMGVNINPYTDYLQNKDTSSDYATATHIAAVTTRLLADQYNQLMTLVQQNALSLDDATQRAIKTVAVHNITTAMDTVAAQVQATDTASLTPDKLDTLSTTLSTVLSAPSLKQLEEMKNQIQVNTQRSEKQIDTLLQNTGAYFQLSTAASSFQLTRYQLTPEAILSQHCVVDSTDCLTADTITADQTYSLDKTYSGYRFNLASDTTVLLTKGFENPLPANTTLPANLILPTLPSDFCIDTGSQPGKRIILSGIQLAQSLPSSSQLASLNDFSDPLWNRHARLLDHYLTLDAALQDLPVPGGPQWPAGPCPDNRSTCLDDEKPFLGWLDANRTQWTFCPRAPSSTQIGRYTTQCRTDETGQPYLLKAPAHLTTDNQRWLAINSPNTPHQIQLWINAGTDFQMRTYTTKDQPYALILLDQSLTELVLNQYQEYLTGQRRCTSR